MGLPPDMRAAYEHGKRDPLWRGLGLLLLLLGIGWLSLLGLYDVLLWVAEAVRGG